jgi:hypothetical protein
MIPKLPRHELLNYPLEFYQGLTREGRPVTLCRRGSVPRIDDSILDCMIYLYPSVAEAEDGRRAGGAGFWVGVDSEEAPAFWHPYAVTNRHVVNKLRGKSGVIRVNRIGGGFDIIETDLDGWLPHPNGDDVAVYPLNVDLSLKTRYVSRRQFLSPERIAKLDIGPGNNVFMVSRVMSHSGKFLNTPALRFGNISMMPIEPVINADYLGQESFLVEGRSLAGTSGSPVFVQFSIEDHARPEGPHLADKTEMETGPWLLGINWGHLQLVDPDYEFIVKSSDSGYVRHPNGWRVRVNTGIMQVVPAWKIWEILELPELIERRRVEHAFYLKQAQDQMAILDAMGINRERQRAFTGWSEEVQKQIEPKAKPGDGC